MKQVVIAEEASITGAFRRSKELTAFEGLRVLGVLDAVALTMPADYLAGLVIVRTFTLALWSTAETAVYVELRAVKDGPVVNQLEEIFA